MDLNGISDSIDPPDRPDTVLGQLGPVGRDSFNRLLRWLLQRTGAELRVDYRIAPSLTTRSECELLGLSAPRFAIRSHVSAPAQGGERIPAFFNLRRLEWIKAAIDQTHDQKLTDLNEHAVVAEALLGECSPRIHGFSRLTCDLGHAYGEDGTVTTGTPFMQHVDVVGGGMCAQACLQMAICLQQEHAKQIPSVAEITALAELAAPAKNGILPGTMKLRGLDAWQISDVLRRQELELYGVIESYGMTGNRVRPVPANGLPNLGYVLATYLASHVPVIALVRLPRLAEPGSIYETNSIRPVLTSQESSIGHAVLLVGYRSHKGHDEFLINDPATYPFLRATSDQLLACRTGDSQLQLDLQFIPVLPEPVRLTLVGRTPRPRPQETSPKERDPIGLLWLAKALQKSPVTRDPPLPPIPKTLPPIPKTWSWPGEFHLVDFHCQDLERTLGHYVFSGCQDSDRKTLAKQLLHEIKQDATHQGTRWKWVQTIGPVQISGPGEVGHVWIWNAEHVLKDYRAQENRPAVEAVYDRGAGCLRRFKTPTPATGPRP